MAKRPPDGAQQARPPYTIPRSWVAGLVVLLVVPWLVAFALYARSGAPAAPAPAVNAEAALEPAASTLAPGPWGELVTTPIVISPPLEQVPSNWGPIVPAEWRFPDASRDALDGFLRSTGLSPAQVSALLAAAQPEPRIRGLVVRPDPALLWSLTPDVRAALYMQLAQTGLNPRQQDAYRYGGATPEEWLGSSLVSPETFQLVRPLIYRQGSFLYFADIDLVRTRVRDPEALQRLAKALFRVSTMVVELRVPNGSNLGAVAEYRGRGGRRTDILPLLESVTGAETHRQIDITHLLPPTARLNLYRYPRVTLEDLQRPQLVNCLWTALNFFNPRPDDRLVDLDTATAVLRRDYYFVHDRFQLGDLLVLTDSTGALLHVAVYLADDLVFTKNGMSALSPWVIMNVSGLKGYYLQYGENLQVQYYRRNDL